MTEMYLGSFRGQGIDFNIAHPYMSIKTGRY